MNVAGCWYFFLHLAIFKFKSSKYMDATDNVRKAFAPLGERLYFFESELHLLENNEHDIPINQHDFYYHDMIDKIGRDVNRFDSFQVYLTAEEYLKRTYRLTHQLVRQEKENKSVSRDKWQMWEAELYEYLHGLLAILDAREEIYKETVSTNATVVIEKKIELPKDFTIKELQVHFKPKYNYSVIAALMHYMSKAGILPPYEQSEFTKIAPIFGFHSKSIAKGIRFLNPNSKSELKKVKAVVDALVEAISEDLQKANKP